MIKKEMIIIEYEYLFQFFLLHGLFKHPLDGSAIGF